MTSLDPFLFEVLRHRLSTLTVEAAIALQRVSGSPLATEAFDMNTSIMTAAGDVIFAGPYLLTGPVGQGLIVRSILRDANVGGGLEPGDRFICNDPYSGSAHQNCVTLVAPLFSGSRLIAWAGATLHVVDVGGKTAGQVGIGARSIHEEAPVIPPTRIVASGRILDEVEAAYIGRSRTPEINALDLRAKIAALNTIERGVAALVAAHGAERIVDVLDLTLARSTAHFRSRVAELPDGTARHSAYVDQVGDDGRIEHRIVDLELSKRGDRLLLDFRGSADQAPAVVNCTRSGLLSGLVIGLMTTLVWDAPWCPAAIERSIEVVSRPGSVVDAAWPAGCSMATMAAGFAVTTVTAVAIGELLGRDDGLRTRALAAWAGAVGSVDVFGTDARGNRFGTVLLDTMAAGTGAGPVADGIDCGGFLRSIGCVIANVEHTEALFPLLYLFRRQEPDTGGPGRHRGGAGAGYAIIPHGVDRIDTVSPHFSGSTEPESTGLAGGLPGATNAAIHIVGSGVLAARSAGKSAATPEELGGERRVLPGVANIALDADDVLLVITTGGGGYGDPIERDPDAVARDVRAGLVSLPGAQLQYGVVLGDDGGVDEPATREARAAIRAERMGPEAQFPAAAAHVPDSDALMPDGAVPVELPDGRGLRCPRCGHVEPTVDGVDAAGLRRRLRPLRAASRHNPDTGPNQPFLLEEIACPACGRLLTARRVLSPEAVHA